MSAQGPVTPQANSGHPYPQQGMPVAYQQQMPPQQWQPAPQPAPAAPAGVRVPDDKAKVFGFAAIGAGVISLVGSPTVALGVIAGIAAIVLGYLVWNQVRPLAIAGLAVGALGIVLSGVLFIAGYSIFGKLVFVPVTGNVKASYADDIDTIHDPVVDELPFHVQDTRFYDFTVTELQLDEGELIVHFTAYDGNDSSASTPMHYVFYCPEEVCWTINGVPVEPLVFNQRVDNGQTVEGWFYFNQETMEPLGIESLDDIYSLHGEVFVDAYVNGNVAATYHDRIDV